MGCTPSVSFPQEAFSVKTKTPMCSLSLSLSLTSVQESGDIGLQGKQQAEEENGKHCVCCTHLLSHATNGVFGVKHSIFLFPPVRHSL